MKRLVALLLTSIMCLSLVACSNVDKNVYSVGQKVSTNCAELTLKSFEFAEKYNSIGLPGKVFAVLSFSLKNIGKTELGFIKTVDGKSSSLKFSSIPCIDYNNGYLFPYDDMMGLLDLCFPDLAMDRLDPLSSDVTIEVAIAIPPEVETNVDNPLLVKMAVPTNGGTKVFTYKIR